MSEVPLYTQNPDQAQGFGQFFCGERGGNNLNAVKDIYLEKGSSQGQNRALAGLFVPSSLESGLGQKRQMSRSSRGGGLLLFFISLKPRVE